MLTDISGILKERLFGLSSEEGNHGESIKEAHFHLDNLPTVRLFAATSLQNPSDHLSTRT